MWRPFLLVCSIYFHFRDVEFLFRKKPFLCVKDIKDPTCNVSANVAYSQVKLESSAPEVYEELDTLVLAGGEVNNSATPHYQPQSTSNTSV